jgi:1,2-diacylglycerol 3-beta-glucosyltransferase
LTALYGYALAALSTRMPSNVARGIDDLFFVLMVPALNEEQVIGRTISSLLKLRGNFLVLVIDDASDDGTVAAIKPFLADPRVRLMEHSRERARCGKGHVLNAGYAAIRQMGLVERYGAENVIVTVFDSDARVNPSFLEDVGPYFCDPKVAGVQSVVRMYNADHNLLTLWQNLEFAIWGRVMCQAKNRLKSATLGGNGQCVRLSALGDLGEEPWQSTSLTEDLDLSLKLLTSGWQLRFCPSAAVWQEAVPEFGKLVRQRSRWMQGHLVCWSYLPELLHGRLPLRTRVDLLIFLLLPAAILPVGLATIVSWAQFLLHLGEWEPWDLAAFYALGFVVAPLAVVYLARVERRGLWRSVLHGHLFIFYSFVWFLAAVAAWQKVLLGRRGWAKTGRVAGSGAGLPDPSTPPLIAVPATPVLPDVQLPPQTVQVLLEEKISDQDAAWRDMMEEIFSLGAALDCTQSRLDDAGARLEDFRRQIRQWKRQIAEQDVAFPARRKPGTGHRLKQPTQVEAVLQVKELRTRRRGRLRRLHPQSRRDQPRY